MIEESLKKEINKWSRKLDSALRAVDPLTDRGSRLLENIRAYREDSKHFMEKRDLIKSFECLIWAWAILETGKELDHLK